MASFGFASQDRRANALFVEAYQLVKEAQEVEKTSYSDAYELYAESLAKLENIISKHSYSKIAVDLIQGNAKLGSYTMEELKNLLNEIEERADAEQDILECAIYVARSIEEDEARANALDNIFEYLFDHKRYEEATDIINEMIKLTTTDHDMQYLLKSKSLILTVQNVEKYIQSEKYEKALSISKEKDKTLTEISEKYLESKQYEKALEFAHRIQTPGRKADALAKIAIGYAKGGQKDRALQLASTIQDIDIRANNKALAVIAEEYAYTNKIEKGLEVANTIKGTQAREKAMAEIAVYLAKDGQDNKAMQILSQLWESSKAEWRYDFEKASLAKSRSEIAVKYSQAGYKQKAFEIIEEALIVANTIEDDWEKHDLLSTLTLAIAQTGEYDKFIDIANEIGYYNHRARIIAKAAIIFAELGKKDKATELLCQSLRIAKSTEDPNSKNEMLLDIAAMHTKISGEKNKCFENLLHEIVMGTQ